MLEEFKNKIIDNDIKYTDNINSIEETSINSLGYENQMSLILYPKSKSEIKCIVDLANEYKIGLYPISKGCNMGYGSKTPIAPNNILIEMKYLNKISNFSPEKGSIRIESGVTQKQLYQYLVDNNLPYFMDATGAREDSSIMGNILDGGFGHTPKGYKRLNFSDIEVILGSGEIIRTNEFPNLGPDLSGLFVQSNFGIVISCEINLNIKTEKFESFIIQVDGKEKLYKMIDNISELKQRNVLTSLVHVANPLRTFMSSNKCPPEFKDKILTNEKAKNIQDYRLLKAFDYTATGGLYGSKEEVKLKKKIIKSYFKGFAKITFFDDKKLNLLKKILKREKLVNLFRLDYIKKTINAFEPTYNLMKGIPTNEMYDNIYWRNDDAKNLGMIWVSPIINANKEELSKVTSILDEKFEKFNFELPITMTFIKPGKLIFIININFNKNNLEEKQKAKKLYEEVVIECNKNNIGFYRKPISFMENIYKHNPEKEKLLMEFKNICDPGHIISQKRYGLK